MLALRPARSADRASAVSVDFGRPIVRRHTHASIRHIEHLGNIGGNKPRDARLELVCSAMQRQGDSGLHGSSAQVPTERTGSSHSYVGARGVWQLGGGSGCVT